MSNLRHSPAAPPKVTSSVAVKGELKRETKTKKIIPVPSIQGKVIANNIRQLKQVQKKWRAILQGKLQIRLRVGRKHHPDFVYFLNNQVILKSLDSEKRKRLAAVLLAGDWNNAILKTKELPYLAMSLCQEQRITLMQLFTVLDYVGNSQNAPIAEVFPILDLEGNFSPAARLNLLSSEAFHASGKEHFSSPDVLESFRLKVAALPQSEQIFYLVPCNNTSLETSLTSLKAIWKATHSESHNLVLSYGAIDALGRALYDRQYKEVFCRLGIQSPLDIEGGVRRGFRIAPAFYPGIIVYGDIHGVPDITYFTASRHDWYHSKVLSCIPLPIQAASLHMVDVARHFFKQDINSLLSKEIWNWIDAEFSYFFYRSNFKNELLTVEKTSEYFYQFLINAEGSYLLSHGKLTPVGAAILIDMLINKERWISNFKIDPEYLREPFRVHFQWLKENYNKHLKSCSKKLQIFKFLMASYKESDLKDQENLLLILSENINEQHIVFRKLKSSELPSHSYMDLRFKNTIIITFHGERNFEAICLLLKIRNYAIGQRQNGDHIVRDFSRYPIGLLNDLFNTEMGEIFRKKYSLNYILFRGHVATAKLLEETIRREKIAEHRALVELRRKTEERIAADRRAEVDLMRKAEESQRRVVTAQTVPRRQYCISLKKVGLFAGVAVTSLAVGGTVGTMVITGAIGVAGYKAINKMTSRCRLSGR